MRLLPAALCWLALLALPAGAGEVGRIVILSVPQVATPNDDLVLHVNAGVLRRGMEIDIYTGNTLLGTVSPFAVRGAHAAGLYAIPVHVPRMSRRLRIRVVLTDAGEPDRTPTAKELRGVSLDIVRRSSTPGAPAPRGRSPR